MKTLGINNQINYSKNIAEMAKLSIVDKGISESMTRGIAEMAKLSIVNRSQFESISKSISQASKVLTNINTFEELSKTMELYRTNIKHYIDENNIDLSDNNYNEEVELDLNIVNNIFLDDELSVQEQLYKVWETFKNKNIIILIIVWQFVISPVLSPIKESYDEFIYETVSSITQSISNNISNNNGKLLNNSIKKDVTKNINDNYYADKKYILNSYRFVNCDKLNVRCQNTTKSTVIFTLSRADVVKILNKQKNWTKIEYKNEDGTVAITGWVFTRYISRFN